MDRMIENKLRDSFGQIVERLQHGEFATAESMARKVLSEYPSDPNILRLSGIALMRQGKYQEAEAQLSSAVAIAPDLAESHEQFGLVLAALGRFDEAETALQEAKKLDPNSASIHSKLARLHVMQGKREEAESSRERAFELKPRLKKLQEATQHQAAGEHEEARKLVKEILRNDPDDVNALNTMGEVCLALKRYNDAEAFLRKAVKLAPDFAVAWSVLSAALKEQAKFEEAVDACEHALQLDPDNAELHCNKGNFLLGWGKEEHALGAFEAALAIKPDHAGALLSKGHVLKTMGNQEDAIAAYHASAKARPELGQVFWSLANLKTFRFEPEEIDLMESQLAAGKLDDESQFHFSYALGKAYEDQGDYAKAFENYTRGGALKRKNIKYDPVEFVYQTDKMIEIFTKEFFAERADFGYSDAAPILIVGLPRSGSTLIEQILSSHSKVDGTAELNNLLQLGYQTGLNRFDNLKYPESIVNLDKRNITAIGKDYIDGTMHHRKGAPYFTDKMPNNFPHIGFLHLILPNAKVIDARRHPLDSCFGTFKQLFAKGQSFSYDLYELGQYYNCYIRLMEHWDNVLPGKVLKVNYEDNVAHLEPQARRMIEHCGLDWEDQILRFYETDRAVKTASSEQVRQPIYSKSVNTWKRYEAQLADLIVMLEDVLAKLPDHIERPQIPS
ncbi:MAG: sulfotransferase [Woeseiaceae bacterium]